MKNFCLNPQLADEFKKRLLSGEIKPEKLNSMTSEERRKYFQSFLGDSGRQVNILFEKNLLLKNQEMAMVRWAKSITGMDAEKKAELAKKIQDEFVRKQNRLYNPAEGEVFLGELVSDMFNKKYKVGITLEEAKEIADLTKKVRATQEIMQKDVSNKANRVAYGNSLLDLWDYRQELAPKTGNNWMSVANSPRTLLSTLDLSAPFRQGWGMVTRKEFWKNYIPMLNYAKDEKAYRDMMADIVSRPNYEMMNKAGLRIIKLSDDLSSREEAFMSYHLDKVPGVRHSERAYAGFLTKLRADIYDNLVRAAKESGEDVSVGSKAAADIAKVVNIFTGSGSLGKNFDKAVPILNALWFSPRKIAAAINMMNPNIYLNKKISRTARMAAIRQLVGSVGTAVTIMELAKAIGADVEDDPRSSDFGKIKVRDTRFDVTGGNSTYAVLLARLITGQTKSTTSEIVSELGENYGSPTRGDILIKFGRNKLSPTASFFADWLYGENAVGKPFTLTSAVASRMFPLVVQDFVETVQEDPTMSVFSTAANLFGIGVQTYKNDVNWNDKPGKELAQMKEKIGAEKFLKANDEYNNRIHKEVPVLLESKEYKDLSEEDKAKKIRSLKEGIKKDIFSEYNFSYQQEGKAKPSLPKKKSSLPGKKSAFPKRDLSK